MKGKGHIWNMHVVPHIVGGVCFLLYQLPDSYMGFSVRTHTHLGLPTNNPRFCSLLAGSIHALTFISVLTRLSC